MAKKKKRKKKTNAEHDGLLKKVLEYVPVRKDFLKNEHSLCIKITILVYLELI